MRVVWLTPDRFERKPDKSSWLEMAGRLRRAGHQITILASGRASPRSSRDDAIVLVPALDFPLVFRITALASMLLWLRRHAAPNHRVIINPDALWLLPLLRLLGLRRVHLDVRTLPVEVHGWKDRLDRLLFWSLPLRWLGRSPVSYSFITERLKDEVERMLGFPIDDYVIWESGVNCELFRPRRTASGRVSGRVRLFYHGNLSLNRGVDTVIEALAMLDSKVDVEFVIAGDGRGAPALKDLVRKLGLKQRVAFRGLLPYERMVEEIAEADLCICPLPDRLEWNVSSPLKVFEYMACAKPMVLTPIPAHLDVLADEPFVVWSEGYGAGPLSKAIERALRDLVPLTRAAEAAPALALQRHDWSRQAERLERYLVGPGAMRTRQAPGR